jgi:hypothetical protein
MKNQRNLIESCPAIAGADLHPGTRSLAAGLRIRMIQGINKHSGRQEYISLDRRIKPRQWNGSPARKSYSLDDIPNWQRKLAASDIDRF